METFISQTSTAACGHCGKDIPASNIDLHYAHCSRKLEKCSTCGDMIPKKHASEHHDDNHAPVACVLCDETVERESLALHGSERCPQRILACEYCDFQLPAVDLYEHQDLCGNRTEFCGVCSRYVRLSQWAEHELRGHACPDAVSESHGFNGPRSGAARPSHAILTIVVTGVAALLVSIFLRRRIGS